MIRALKEHWPEYFCEERGRYHEQAEFGCFAELIIAFILMTVVLNVSNTPHLARFTGVFAGCLVAIYAHRAHAAWE